jgi:hypothetical protein
MIDELPEDEEARLKVLFSPAAAPVRDDGFSLRVTQRLARTARRRRIVLGVAVLAALAIGAEPLWNLAQVLSAQLLESTERLALLRWTADPRVLAAGALLLIAPRVLHWLEE